MTVPAEDQSELGPGLIGAAIAVSAWAAGSVVVKAIDLEGLVVGVYRFGVFVLGAVIVMQLRGQRFRPGIVRDSALGGLALGADIALFFSAVKLTNVVNATLIGSLQPIIVGVVAARFFGESIRRRDAAWSLVALVGVFGVILASNGTPEWSAAGDLLAVGALLSWSGYFIASKQSKGRMTPMEFTVGTAIWVVLINAPLALLFGQDLSWPDAGDWVGLAASVVLGGVVGHIFMNWSLVRIPLWVGSTFTLLIPVVASTIAWIFLGESLSWGQGACMGLVLLALFVIVRGQASPAAVAAEPEPEPLPA